jgi:MoxR-like ATPase
MMKVNVEYADKKHEVEMYKKVSGNFEDIQIEKILKKEEILKFQKILKEIYISDNIFEYV